MSWIIPAAPVEADVQNSRFDWTGGLESAWTKVVTLVPNVLAFVAILVVGWLVAKALAKATDTVLERVGFDRAVERGGIKQALARSRYDASDLVAKLVYYAVLLFTLTLAFGQFGDNPVSRLLTDVVEFLPHVLVAIVIVVVAASIARAVKDLLVNALNGLPYGGALGSAAAAFILGLGIIAAVQQIGVMEQVSAAVLIAVLATLGGVVVVGVGGGLVVPMSRRWERWLDKAESEAERVREAVQHNQEAAAASAATTLRKTPASAETRQMPAVGATEQSRSTEERRSTQRDHDNT